MQRPTSVTVFGILNIIFGALGLLGTVMSAAMLLFAGGFPQPNNPFLGENRVLSIWTMVSLPLGVIATIALIASGVGLLKLRPWGRTTAIGYAIYAIVAGIIGIGLQWMFMIRPMLAQGGPGEAGIIIGFLLVGGCIGLAYPMLLLFFMTRRHVAAAFGGVEWTSLDDFSLAATWEPPSPAESSNPYASPRTNPAPFAMPSERPSSGAPPGTSESIIETLIPSKNGPALASYYLGIFSLFPCLGFPMGVVAVYFGLQGLRRVRQDPAVRGRVHAWVGVICGSLFGLFNFALLALTIVGLVMAAMGR